jgi:excisionase family DNA binding protein
MLTTAEAAAILQVSRRRVNELIRLGTLTASKPGRDWEIDPASVEAYRHTPRKPGRTPRAMLPQSEA